MSTMRLQNDIIAWVSRLHSLPTNGLTSVSFRTCISCRTGSWEGLQGAAERMMWHQDSEYPVSLQ